MMCFHTDAPARGGTDREKLERALDRLGAVSKDYCDDAKLALAAARKHLDSLPKPPTKVRRFIAVTPEGIGYETEATMHAAMGARSCGGPYVTGIVEYYA